MKTCERCGNPVRGRRAGQGRDYCSLRCEDEQDYDNRESARSELAEQAAKEKLCRRCERTPRKTLDEIADFLAKAHAEAKAEQAKDNDSGVYAAMGGLAVSVEIAVSELRGVCFGCWHDGQIETMAGVTEALRLLAEPKEGG